MTTIAEVNAKGVGRAGVRPVIQPVQVTHGTFVTRNLARTQRMLEDVMGMECVRAAPDRLLARHRLDATRDSYWVLDVREVAEIGHPQNMLNHWGLAVANRNEVDRAYERIAAAKDEYGLKRVNKPKEAHKSYSFYFQDADSNWWEIEHRGPESAYAALVSQGDTFE
jgi:catechol 2,3-dioxygenase-like lactoylglutathione lyase family enzyme